MFYYLFVALILVHVKKNSGLNKEYLFFKSKLIGY